MVEKAAFIDVNAAIQYKNTTSKREAPSTHYSNALKSKIVALKAEEKDGKTRQLKEGMGRRSNIIGPKGDWGGGQVVE